MITLIEWKNGDKIRIESCRPIIEACGLFYLANLNDDIISEEYKFEDVIRITWEPGDFDELEYTKND